MTKPERVRADSLARRSRERRTASHAANANIAVTATALVLRVKLSMRIRAWSRRRIQPVAVCVTSSRPMSVLWSRS
ncbi:MAG: hypothetical protein E6K27_13605 [Gammaproteobacteria bacterium]|nr:MAG: hypothetical protein E6K27_13605 [Gammaproteobacteria bacterium]